MVGVFVHMKDRCEVHSIVRAYHILLLTFPTAKETKACLNVRVIRLRDQFNIVAFVWAINDTPNIKLTPCSTVLEKLIVAHLLKRFPVVYGSRRFIILSKIVPHLTLPLARYIQCACSTLYIILPLSPGFLNDLSSVIPRQNFLFFSFILHAATMPSPWLDHCNNL